MLLTYYNMLMARNVSYIKKGLILIMNRKKVLAVDIGTQSLKASIIDQNLETIERFKVSYQPETYAKNCVEINIDILWNAFIKAC